MEVDFEKFFSSESSDAMLYSIPVLWSYKMDSQIWQISFKAFMLCFVRLFNGRGFSTFELVTTYPRLCAILVLELWPHHPFYSLIGTFRILIKLSPGKKC